LDYGIARRTVEVDWHLYKGSNMFVARKE